MKRLDNKVVIVTGGSKGIGAGIAKAFGAEGAAVIVNYARDQAGAEQVVREITGNGGRAIAVQGDVAQRSDTQRLVAEAQKAFGRLDVLVNNAGVFSFAPFEQFSEQKFTVSSTRTCWAHFSRSKPLWRPSGRKAGALSTSDRRPVLLPTRPFRSTWRQRALSMA